MASSALDYCVASLKTPIQILTLPAEHSTENEESAIKLFSDDAALAKFLNETKGRDYSCRFISICQRNSWRPLQVTSSMLSRIIQDHGFSASVRDLSSCFYTKNLDLEDSFCIPFTLYTDGPWIEVSYTIRYPEFKQDEAEWAIRQTGICHRINVETRQSIVLLLSPRANSKAHQHFLQHLTADDTNHYAGNTWFALHSVLLQAHIPAWRAYNRSYEAEFLPIANTTFATYIDEPLRIGYDQLSALSSLHGRFVKATSLIESAAELLHELIGFLDSSGEEVVGDHRRANMLTASLRNIRSGCNAHARTAHFVQQRVEGALQLLASTLTFRDQVIAKQQNGNMLQLNKSAVFITVLTLIYVPASFVATFFGMNFFAMDQDSSRIVCTTMIWVYILTTLAFTTVTVFFYYWLLRHDNLLFWRLAPKIHVNTDWRALVRRFTKLDQPVELKNLNP